MRLVNILQILWKAYDTLRPKMAHVREYSVILLKQKVNDARCRKGSRMLIAIKLVQRSFIKV